MTRKFLKYPVLIILLLCGTVCARAQEYSVKVKLQDSKSGEPVGYAAVSVTKDGQSKVFKYSQTDGNGAATVSGLPAGKYKIEGILLGYDNYSEVITVTGNMDLGVKKMKMQANFLEGATVLDGKLFILTWTNKVAFVYDAKTLEYKQTYSYPREGWGLTTDGINLIASDGTDCLYFMNTNFQTIKERNRK